MDPKTRCRKCYATTRCCCNKNYTNTTGPKSPNALFATSTTLQKPTYYPKSSVSVKNAHSRERFQSLYDTPCASVVSVDQILKPLRLAERDKWVPKYAFTSTTGLPLDGLLCECCSPRGCKCPHKCPTCGQKVDDEQDLQQKKSTYEKPTLCIACRRCRLDQKCFSRKFEATSSTRHDPSESPPRKPSQKTDNATQCCKSQTFNKPKTPPCCATPKTSKTNNMTMSENIIKMLLDKRDESFCSCKMKRNKSQTSECKQRERFGAGSDNKNDTESEELTNAIVTSTTEVIGSDSSCSVTIASDNEGKQPIDSTKLIQKEKNVDKATPSDEFKPFKKNYIVQDMWGISTDLSANKITNISKSKKYVSPQTGRVFNLNKIPAVPKIEVSNHVIPKPLSVHDLLILNPRKSTRNNIAKVSKGVSGHTNKIINSEFISLRGGTDKKKIKTQKNISEKFRFPNMNLLFSTPETTPPTKIKANSFELSGKSSELSNCSNQDDFLEKQVQEVLQKAKTKAGILAPLSSKFAVLEDILKSSQLSKEILCTSDAAQPRSTGGQDDSCDELHKKSSERCEFSRFLNSQKLPLAATLQQKIINFDDMVKTRLSSLIMGRLPDLYDSVDSCCNSKRFRKEQGHNLGEFRLPYTGCASKCRTYDDIVKSKLSSLILGRIPEVKFECESSNCIACSKNSVSKGNGLLSSHTGICKPLNIRRLPCTTIPRALMRFDDIIKAKLSSAILGTYITPETILSNSSSRDCTPHTQYLPTPRTVLLPTTVCTQRNQPKRPVSPKQSNVCPSKPCSSPMKMKPSASPKNLPRVCTPCPSPRSCSPKSSVMPSCPSKQSKNWCPPKQSSSKIWSDCSPKRCSSRNCSPCGAKSGHTRDCSTPPMKQSSSRSGMPVCSSRQSTCSPNRVNFDMMNVPCIPSVCDVGTGCEPRKKRTCSSFTSICTNRCTDPCHDLSCAKPMCVRDFRGPELNFSFDHSRKRNRSVCKPCSTPCPTFFPTISPCRPCERCERPKSTGMSPCNNPYLDPNWTASCTNVHQCLSSAMDLCRKPSKIHGACCNICNPCPLCRIRSPICDIPICASNFKRICSHKETCKMPKCGPCGNRSYVRSAPCKPTCNPYMDCNWTSSPSMQCLGYDSCEDCRISRKSSSAKCCTGPPTRCNDRWCYYYTLEKTDFQDFIEYPPLPQNKYLTPEDFDYPMHQESDCSIDTINSILAINSGCESSESCMLNANSTPTLQVEEGTSTSESSVIAELDLCELTTSEKELNSILNTEKEGQYVTDDYVSSPPNEKNQEGDQNIQSFYKDTIISYCFLQEIPAFSQAAVRNLSRVSDATACTSTTTEATEAKLFSYQDCSTACVYQDDFAAETHVEHDQTDDKFTKAIEKICALAKASTTFKQKTRQTNITVSGDMSQNSRTKYSLRMTKEIYNIQLGFACTTVSIQDQMDEKHESLKSIKRKCSSLLSLRRKDHDIFESENLNDKELEKHIDDSVPSWKFRMKYYFPIIRGRINPNYKPVARAKSKKYMRLVKDISEYRESKL